MTFGVLLFAHNNSDIDYIKQSLYCAKQIKKHLNLPVTLVTSSKEYLLDKFPFYKKYIDTIIEDSTSYKQNRKFYDGAYSYKTLNWNNFTRSDCYNLSPYDKTIVMDTDFIVGNSKLLDCVCNAKVKISKKVTDLHPSRNDFSLEKVSDTSMDMYWATVFYFEKNHSSKLFFDLVKHIKDNWHFYRLQYQIIPTNFRNDFAFSIALHIINGFGSGSFSEPLPIKVWFTSDKDKIISYKNNSFSVLIEEPLVIKVKDVNIHLMNKFSLDRIVTEDLKDE